MLQRQDLVGSTLTWQRPTLYDMPPPAPCRRRWARLRGWRGILAGIVLLATLVGGGWELTSAITSAQASCPTYRVQWGDTMWMIAQRYHTDTWTLARLNHISNPNIIIAGQLLCVGANTTTTHTTQPGSGNPNVLEWSTRPQVHDLLIQAADRHRLPRNLVLAIAWRESNWTQHVISWDGGVGTMQLMSYTTAWLDGYLGRSYSAYRLGDNIELGVSYLAILWNDFGGNLNNLISGYNEGERNVRTYGIFNWWYVNSVRALMQSIS